MTVSVRTDDETGGSPHLSLVRRLLPSVALRLGGQLAGAAIGAAFLVCLTRLLGPAEFGFFVTATTLVTLASALADGGLVSIGVRRAARPGGDRDLSTISEVALARLALSVLSVGVVLLVVRFGFVGGSHRQVRMATAILALSLPLGALTSGYQVRAESRLRVTPLVVADLAGRLVALAGCVVAIALNQGLAFVCVAAVAGSTASLVVLVATYRTGPLDVRRPSPAAAARLVATAFPLGLALILNAVYFRVDTLMISLIRPASEVGTYGVAYRILEITLSVGALVLAGLLPVLSATAGAPEQWRAMADVAFRLLFALGLVVSTCGAIVAAKLVIVVSGPKYASAGTALAVLLLAGSLSWVNGCGGTMLVSIERQKDALWLNVVALTVNVVLNLALIPRFGYIAAAWTTAGCELVNFAGMVWLVRRYGDYRWRIQGWQAIVVLTAFCAALTEALQVLGVTVLVLVPLVAAAWGAAAIKLNIVPQSMLRGRSPAAVA